MTIIFFSGKSENAPIGRSEVTPLLKDIFKIHFIQLRPFSKTLFCITGSWGYLSVSPSTVRFLFVRMTDLFPHHVTRKLQSEDFKITTIHSHW